MTRTGLLVAFDGEWTVAVSRRDLSRGVVIARGRTRREALRLAHAKIARLEKVATDLLYAEARRAR